MTDLTPLGEFFARSRKLFLVAQAVATNVSREIERGGPVNSRKDWMRVRDFFEPLGRHLNALNREASSLVTSSEMDALRIAVRRLEGLASPYTKPFVSSSAIVAFPEVLVELHAKHVGPLVDAARAKHPVPEYHWPEGEMAANTQNTLKEPEIPLKPAESKVLICLNKRRPQLCTQEDIAEGTRYSTNTVSKSLKRLREVGLVHRPMGDRGGETLTVAGERAAKRLLQTVG